MNHICKKERRNNIGVRLTRGKLFTLGKLLFKKFDMSQKKIPNNQGKDTIAPLMRPLHGNWPAL
ncbi:hypothetical protein PORCRE_1618 [Porphyromonas crevioricanis JCM 15906]|uniref:Uncharacterized protein n=1 Tax=Porphyromonas crevioricanis JCM 15906 TaxID=1305617 RepID=T1CS21_9PORP|nr:hypothetical protein PORCRE_1618 [Porphyromonas crevioricanis JCM 15906]